MELDNYRGQWEVIMRDNIALSVLFRMELNNYRDPGEIIICKYSTFASPDENIALLLFLHSFFAIFAWN